MDSKDLVFAQRRRDAEEFHAKDAKTATKEEELV
jgi:hypothetical protein